MTGALVVFCVTYLVLATRLLRVLGLDRPAASLVGAVAMAAVGGLGLDGALEAVDLHVVTLLLGVLIIAAYLTEAQFFRLAAYHVLTRMKSARTLLWGLTWLAGGLSALLVNDTVCVVLTPLVVAVVVEARLPALPYLLALASASNLGGVVSYSGNPQNMLVGQAAAGHPSFAHYLALTLPAGAACLVANALLLSLLFRKDLPRGPLVERTPPKPAIDTALAIKALGALALFAGLALAGVALAGASITAAAALIVIARVPPKRALGAVDWSLLLFFSALFVVVHGLARTGAVEDVYRWLEPVIGRGDLAGDAAFIALVVLGANLVSNVPLVLIAVHWVPHLASPAWGYVMLAVSSTLAGNLTLFGSVANIIVFESAGPRGEIGFFRFLRFGAVLTIVSLLVAFGVLELERVLGYASMLGVP
ncbi:MAG TPA: SLC13 family permease [Kofleriaceae bacterium]|nr:SLC13 family permease [Kofleriaceae bacterium]